MSFIENELFRRPEIEIKVDGIIRKCDWKGKLGTNDEKDHVQR